MLSLSLNMEWSLIAAMRCSKMEGLVDVDWRKVKSLPFELEGIVIYFVGPTPDSKPGEPIGSAGPTN